MEILRRAHVHIIDTSNVRSNSSKNCFHGRTLCGVLYDKKNYLTLEASTEITLAFNICTLKTLDDSSFPFFSFIKNIIKEKKKKLGIANEPSCFCASAFVKQPNFLACKFPIFLMERSLKQVLLCCHFLMFVSYQLRKLNRAEFGLNKLKPLAKTRFIRHR